MFEIITRLLEITDRYSTLKDILRLERISFIVQEGTITEYRNVKNIIINPDVLEQENPLIIAAHYDRGTDKNHMPSPGANDNASSISILMQLIKEIERPDIGYIFFDREELPERFSGSRYFARQLSKEQRQKFKVINLDTCGIGDIVFVGDYQDKTESRVNNGPLGKAMMQHITGLHGECEALHFRSIDQYCLKRLGIDSTLVSILPKDELQTYKETEKIPKVWQICHTQYDKLVQKKALEKVHGIMREFVMNY